MSTSQDIKLVSKDQKEFTITKEVARESGLLTSMMESEGNFIESQTNTIRLNTIP